MWPETLVNRAKIALVAPAFLIAFGVSGIYINRHYYKTTLKLVDATAYNVNLIVNSVQQKSLAKEMDISWEIEAGLPKNGHCCRTTA